MLAIEWSQVRPRHLLELLCAKTTRERTEKGHLMSLMVAVSIRPSCFPENGKVAVRC